MVGQVKSHLESNPKPTSDARRIKQNLVCTRRPHRDWVWVSPAEIWVSSGLLQRQGLWVWHKCQGPLSMGFSRQEYWSGLPCPPSRGSSRPGDHLVAELAGPVAVARGLSRPWVHGVLAPQPGMEPTSTALQGRFFTTWPPGKSHHSTFWAFLV